MTGQMGLGKKTKAGDSTGIRKLPPLVLAAWMEAQLVHHARKKSLQFRQAAQRFGIATVSFNNPFNTSHRQIRGTSGPRARLSRFQ